jgi:O-antigen ligase
MADTGAPGRGEGGAAALADADRDDREGGDSAVCDVVGALLLAACAAWTIYSSSGRDAQPEGVLLGLLAVAAGYATGRIAGAVLPVGAPFGLAAAVAVLAPLAGVRLHDDDVLTALLSLAIGAACCAGYAARRHRLRWTVRFAVVLALALAAESLLTQSTLGTLACGGTLVVAGSVHRARHRGPALVLLALSVLLAVGSTVVLAQDSRATTTDSDAVVSGPASQVSAQRLALWRDAVHEFDQEPLRGVGPGRFVVTSPAAQQSTDPAGAASAALQTAAEQGLPGVLLLGCAFGWTLWALARSPRPTAAVLSVGGAMAALGVQAAMSSVLSVPGVVVGGGLLLGLGAARPMAAPVRVAAREPGPFSAIPPQAPDLP